MVDHLPYTHGCFVCGVENPHGLNLRFAAEGGEVSAEFTPRPDHAGYPGLLHGGAISAALDEVMFWAATHAAGRMHLSVELTVRYRGKVLVGERHRVIGRLVEQARSMCRTEAELVGPTGAVCASAKGKFLPLPAKDAHIVAADFYTDPVTVDPQRYMDGALDDDT